MNDLISLLNSRFSISKKFTEQEFVKQAKQALKDYEADDEWLNSFAESDRILIQVTKRYEIIIPLIFQTHEGMMASMFDRLPDLIVDQGGKNDEDKARLIKAAYKYIREKCDLEEFMNEAAWWYLLLGFTSAHVGYDQIIDTVPVTDDETGEQVYAQIVKYDDPTVSVDKYDRVFFSPESEYSIDASKVPYYCRKKMMTPEKVYQIYNQVVEPTGTVAVGSDKDEYVDNEDMKRAEIRLYYGNLPEKYAEQIEELGAVYSQDGWYYAVFTKDKILFIERTEKDMRTCALLKLHGRKDKFFGWGLAKLLKPFQKEKSLRRTQMARYADIAAYPKILHDDESDIDESSMADPRANVSVLYHKNKPEYLSPPDMGNIVREMAELADADAQSMSGMLDLSQNAQSSNTIDTATGQAIFAEAAQKRVRKSKRHFMLFYKQVVITMLKLAQLHWTEEKVVNITDDMGENMEVRMTAETLKDIDFDTDITIDPDSLTVNEDVIRQQAIELYNKVKDDPLVNRKEVFKDMIKDGFNKQNPEKYIKDIEVEPGTKLVDPATGQQYEVDDSGGLVSSQDQMEMADPTGGDPASSQAGLMGAAQRMV